MIRLSRLVAAFFVLAITLHADTIRNDDVLRMVAAGLSAQIIVEKIQASDTEFDISTDGLIQLHAQKVPEAVIRRMIQQTRDEARISERAREAAAPRPAAAAQPAAGSRPAIAPAPAPAPARLATGGGKRYSVGVHRTKYNRCPGEIRIDASGIESFQCMDANVKFAWKSVASICTAYGARGEMTIRLTNGKSQLFSTTTPVETVQLADRISAVAPSSISVTRCE